MCVCVRTDMCDRHVFPVRLNRGSKSDGLRNVQRSHTQFLIHVLMHTIGQY